MTFLSIQSVKSLCMALAMAAIIAVSAPMQASAASNIAVLNIQGIMRDSLAGKSIRKKLEDKQKSFQSEMSKKEADLRKKEENLVKQRSVLAPEEFEKKVKGFRDQATKAQRDVQKKKAKLDKAFSEALAKIQSTVVTIVEDMAQERKLDAVVPASQLLYASSSLDITKEVLAKLNKKMPSVKVNF